MRQTKMYLILIFALISLAAKAQFPTSENTVFLYYPPATTGADGIDYGPKKALVNQFETNGLPVNYSPTTSTIPVKYKYIILEADNDGPKYHKYLDDLCGKLNGKILITYSCYAEGDDIYYRAKKRRCKTKQIIHFDHLLNPQAVSEVLNQLAKCLKLNTDTQKPIKDILIQAADNAIRKSPQLTDQINYLKSFLITSIAPCGPIHNTYYLSNLKPNHYYGQPGIIYSA